MEDLLRALATMRFGAVGNYICPGLRSSLIGTGPGKVRLFEAERDTAEFPVTPHSHRYDFTALVLGGTVVNTVYHPQGAQRFFRPNAQVFALGSLVYAGAAGQYTVHRPDVVEPMYFSEEVTTYAPTETYRMLHDEVHSIRFLAGAKVLMFEGPNLRDTSVFLEPWVEGFGRVETFRNEPWMFKEGL